MKKILLWLIFVFILASSTDAFISNTSSFKMNLGISSGIFSGVGYTSNNLTAIAGESLIGIANYTSESVRFGLQFIIPTNVTPTNADLNLSFGPPTATVVRFETCGPSITNGSALPQLQTDSFGIDYLCNNGTNSGSLQIRLNTNPATGWNLYFSNVPRLYTLLNTSWQFSYHSLFKFSYTSIFLRHFWDSVDKTRKMIKIPTIETSPIM